jgi:hypothetical protein
VPVFDTTTALTPPILNAVGVLKFVPVMVTSVPTAPCAGEKEAMVGEAASATRADTSKKIAISKSFDLIV